MMMETQEAMASKEVVKGKRTKRQRPPSPPTLTMASTSSSGGGGGGGGGGVISDNSGGILDRSTTSPTTSAEFTDSTEEEEDMANCLILLAQGRHSRKLSEPMAAASAATKVGLYVYQCKTCNRCFPSFQALGGHRASHKKLKANTEDQKKVMYLMEEGDDRFSNTSTTLSLQIPNRAKFHECSICGAEFTSGQALGGHMRRHRSNFTSSAAARSASTTMSLGTSSGPESTQTAMDKQRNVVELDLDLNLPAPPEDGHQESKFSFKSKEQVIVFSASSLVDCHY